MKRVWQVGWVSMGFALVLGGCVAGAGYQHSTATVAEQNKDYVECSALSRQGSPSDGILPSMIRRKLMDACLESRGWEK